MKHKEHKMVMSALIAQVLKEKGEESSITQLTNLLKEKGHDGFQQQVETFNKIYSDFERMFKLEFNPTSSVIGSVISQEIIKVITLRDSPAYGLMLYNAFD